MTEKREKTQIGRSEEGPFSILAPKNEINYSRPCKRPHVRISGRMIFDVFSNKLYKCCTVFLVSINMIVLKVFILMIDNA